MTIGFHCDSAILLRIVLLLLLFSLSKAGWCEAQREIHDQLVVIDATVRPLALTLDACSGKYDNGLIRFLIRNRIPATIFATKIIHSHAEDMRLSPLVKIQRPQIVVFSGADTLGRPSDA